MIRLRRPVPVQAPAPQHCSKRCLYVIFKMCLFRGVHISVPLRLEIVGCPHWSVEICSNFSFLLRFFSFLPFFCLALFSLIFLMCEQCFFYYTEGGRYLLWHALTCTWENYWLQHGTRHIFPFFPFFNISRADFMYVHCKMNHESLANCHRHLLSEKKTECLYHLYNPV